MNSQTQEWAETRSIKQTKLPKKAWIKQQDGSSYAMVKMIRDKDGCVIRIEPIEALKAEQVYQAQYSSLNEFIAEMEKDPEFKKLMQQEKAKLLAYFQSLEQPAWQGLTDDEVDDLLFDDFGVDIDEWFNYARAIEQALKDKNDN